mgnify:CR=1 FL=1
MLSCSGATLVCVTENNKTEENDPHEDMGSDVVDRGNDLYFLRGFPGHVPKRGLHFCSSFAPFRIDSLNLTAFSANFDQFHTDVQS